MNNYAGHNTSSETEAALLYLNATVWNLPPNLTHLSQPCDLFVITKIKDT
jgi:hypothetical protein